MRVHLFIDNYIALGNGYIHWPNDISYPKGYVSLLKQYIVLGSNTIHQVR